MLAKQVPPAPRTRDMRLPLHYQHGDVYGTSAFIDERCRPGGLLCRPRWSRQRSTLTCPREYTHDLARWLTSASLDLIYRRYGRIRARGRVGIVLAKWNYRLVSPADGGKTARNTRAGSH